MVEVVVDSYCRCVTSMRRDLSHGSGVPDSVPGPVPGGTHTRNPYGFSKPVLYTILRLYVIVLHAQLKLS
jgi:hypothetical protein